MFCSSAIHFTVKDKELHSIFSAILDYCDYISASLNIACEQIYIQNTPKKRSDNNYRTVIRFVKAYTVNRISCFHWLKQNCLSS